MKHYAMALALSIFSLICLNCNSEQNADQMKADWVLTNGRVYTANSETPWADTIAIRDGLFAYVGSRDDAQASAFEGARLTDLGGQMVIPGMIDGHTHPGLIGIEQFNANFEATDHEAFLAELKAFAEANPGKGWVRGCCWPVMAYVKGNEGPDRELLDAIFPDRPVWITSSFWHSYWLNSKAMQELGIGQGSRDPKFPIAMYKRDPNGRLTGWIKEGAGWQFFKDVFEVDHEIHQRSVRAFLQALSEHGVTTVYDGGNLDYSDAIYGFLSDLEKAGELPLRYEGTYMISVPERRKIAVSEMKRFREAYGGDRLQFNTIKLFMDGVGENRSGAMLDPYADDPNYVSDTTLSVEELRDLLLELHEEKFDLHVHVIGDLAVKSVLDAVEEAHASVGDSFYPRVTMAHLQNIHASDRVRFAELGVSANFTAWWHGYDDPDPTATALGPIRSADTYTAKPLFDSGGNVTFSSDDWRLEVLSPFLGMQVGHTRKYPPEMLPEGSDVNAFRLPETEKLGLDLMLRGYTINGAYPLRKEDQIGSIEPGKIADFVVLEESLFEMDPDSIYKTKPTAVVMEGELIQGELR